MKLCAFFFATLALAATAKPALRFKQAIRHGAKVGASKCCVVKDGENVVWCDSRRMTSEARCTNKARGSEVATWGPSKEDIEAHLALKCNACKSLYTTTYSLTFTDFPEAAQVKDKDTIFPDAGVYVEGTLTPDDGGAAQQIMIMFGQTYLSAELSECYKNGGEIKAADASLMKPMVDDARGNDQDGKKVYAIGDGHHRIIWSAILGKAVDVKLKEGQHCVATAFSMPRYSHDSNFKVTGCAASSPGCHTECAGKGGNVY